MGTTARRLLHAGIFGEMTEAFRRFLGELRAWQRKEQKRLRKKFSIVGKGFSEQQLGSRRKPFFKGKAAESRHALGFCVETLQANEARVEGATSIFPRGVSPNPAHTPPGRPQGPEGLTGSVQARVSRAGGEPLLKAGWELLSVYQCVRKDTRGMTQARCAKLVASTTRFLRFWRQAGP